MVKNLPASSGDPRDTSLTPGSERSPGVGNGKPLQYSFLKNSVDSGAWWATVVGLLRVCYECALTPALSMKQRSTHILANHMNESTSEALLICSSSGRKVVLLPVSECLSLHPNYTHATSYRTTVIMHEDQPQQTSQPLQSNSDSHSSVQWLSHV